MLVQSKCEGKAFDCCKALFNEGSGLRRIHEVEGLIRAQEKAQFLRVCVGPLRWLYQVRRHMIQRRRLTQYPEPEAPGG